MTLRRLQGLFFLLFSAGLVAWAAALCITPAQALRAWLLAFNLCFSLASGGLLLLMLQYAVPSDWGMATRRQLNALAALLLPLGIAFVPILLGLRQLYPAAREALPPAGSPEHFKHLYLQSGFFISRAVAFFVVWCLLARYLRRNPRLGQRFAPRGIAMASAVGLALYFITFTLVGTDWFMSIIPGWSSSIFPVQLMMGHVVHALAFVIICSALALPRGLSARTAPPFINHLGSMLLAFTILWIYMAFMQYLIIWSGNLADDNAWFVQRSHGLWPFVALALAAVHFALPVALLLARPLRATPRYLAGIALVVLGGRLLDAIWVIVPSYPGALGALHWPDATALVALPALCGFAICRALGRAPLLLAVEPEQPVHLAESSPNSAARTLGRRPPLEAHD